MNTLPPGTRLELFRSDPTNAIESVAVTDPGNPNAVIPVPSAALCPATTTGYCNQDVNIGKEVHEGVEVKLQSTPVPRLTVDGSYAYINRTINYDFSSDPNVSQIHTSIIILPTLPKNKL